MLTSATSGENLREWAKDDGKGVQMMTRNGKVEFPVVCNCASARLCVPSSSSSDEKLRSQNGVQEMAHAGSPQSYIQVLQVLPSTFTFPPVYPPEVSGVESTTQSVVRDEG